MQGEIQKKENEMGELYQLRRGEFEFDVKTENDKSIGYDQELVDAEAKKKQIYAQNDNWD
jgi:hypothetical protein